MVQQYSPSVLSATLCTACIFNIGYWVHKAGAILDKAGLEPNDKNAKCWCEDGHDCVIDDWLVPGRLLPYLGMLGRFFVVMTPVFEIFDLTGFLFYASSWSDWPSLSAEKIILSLITFRSRDTWIENWSNFSPKCII